MGVSDLWHFLRASGAMREWSAESEGPAAVQKACAAQVDGLVVAVDLSLWACQALLQPDLGEAFKRDEARVLKVVFDRIINYLRFGCTPVAVLDGVAPVEKLQVLQKRFTARFGCDGGGGGNAHFDSLCMLAAGLFQAMGLWALRGPGEAEAMCAALNSAGHVDACTTNDGDALLFGAETLFHTLRIVTGLPKDCKVSRVSMADVRAYFGIEEGGALALTALALLTGGDYNAGGADKVGHKQAVAVVRHLLKGQQSDSEVLDDLAELLAAAPEEDLVLLSQGSCTGCKRCGHEGGRKGRIKAHSARNPCGVCAMEGGACVEAAHQGCGCAWHTREDERIIFRAVEKVRATPGFAAAAGRAKQAYQAQTAQAAEAVRTYAAACGLNPGDRMMWRHRPDVYLKAAIEGGLEWKHETVRRKMRALLMEWDASHPGPQAEFVPRSIVKLQGGEEANCWRYLMTWERSSAGSVQDAEGDRAALAGESDVKITPEHRALRLATVRQFWPALLAAHTAKRATAEAKARKAAERKAAKAAQLGAKQALEQQQACMQAFFRKPVAGKAAAGAAAAAAALPAQAGGIDGGGRGLGAAPLDARAAAHAAFVAVGLEEEEEAASEEGAASEEEAPAAVHTEAVIEEEEEEEAALEEEAAAEASTPPEAVVHAEPVIVSLEAEEEEEEEAATDAEASLEQEQQARQQAGPSPRKRQAHPGAEAPSTPRGAGRQGGKCQEDVAVLGSPGKRRRAGPLSAQPEARAAGGQSGGDNDDGDDAWAIVLGSPSAALDEQPAQGARLPDARAGAAAAPAEAGSGGGDGVGGGGAGRKAPRRRKGSSDNAQPPEHLLHPAAPAPAGRQGAAGDQDSNQQQREHPEQEQQHQQQRSGPRKQQPARGRGRGRRGRGRAAAVTPTIERFFAPAQRAPDQAAPQPAPAEVVPQPRPGARAGRGAARCGTAAMRAPAAPCTPARGAAEAAEQCEEEFVDLTQSSPPSLGKRRAGRGGGGASAGDAREEPTLATPLPRGKRTQKALWVTPPSTGSDFAIDLSTPPSAAGS